MIKRVSVEIELNAYRTLRIVFWGLVAFEILLFMLDGFVSYVKVVGDYGNVHRITNLTREDSIGTWFACLQAFWVSMAFLAVGLVQRTLGSPEWKRWCWFLLALFFFYVSVDDGSKIHERVGSMAGELLEEKGGEDHPLLNFPTYYWHMVYMPAFFFIGLFIFGFLWVELKTMAARLTLLAALGFYVLSQGLDFLEEIEPVQEAVQDFFDASEYTVLHFSKISEELMEMVGTTFFLIMPLKYLIDRLADLRVRFLLPD